SGMISDLDSTSAIMIRLALPAYPVANPSFQMNRARFGDQRETMTLVGIGGLIAPTRKLPAVGIGRMTMSTMKGIFTLRRVYGNSATCNKQWRHYGVIYNELRR